MKIGENIKQYRIKKGYTQEALANAVGVSPQAVSKWENDENIPDGEMLIPIATALGISLDRLFGYTPVYESDVYESIIKLLDKTPRENHFEKGREICWQIQKGITVGHMNADYSYNENEMNNLHGSSAKCDNFGFTIISNRKELPFFTIFPEPEKGYGAELKYDEKYREFFEALADEYVLKAFFYLFSREIHYTFEKEVLMEALKIPPERIDDVIEKLSRFCFDSRTNEYFIDGKKRFLFTVNLKYELVGFFAILNEFLFYGNSFTTLHANSRTNPLL